MSQNPTKPLINIPNIDRYNSKNDLLSVIKAHLKKHKYIKNNNFILEELKYDIVLNENILKILILLECESIENSKEYCAKEIWKLINGSNQYIKNDDVSNYYLATNIIEDDKISNTYFYLKGHICDIYFGTRFAAYIFGKSFKNFSYNNTCTYYLNNNSIWYFIKRLQKTLNLSDFGKNTYGIKYIKNTKILLDCCQKDMPFEVAKNFIMSICYNDDFVKTIFELVSLRVTDIKLPL
jgi:hypothetical protein